MTKEIKAVHLACEILDELQNTHTAGVTEIANRVGHSKSTVHRQLATLESNEYVVRENGTYRLSLRFLEISEYLTEHIENYDEIVRSVDDLAKETGEVAQFAVEEHGQVVYLYKSEGDRGVKTASNIGSRKEMHSTSLGKSILAHKPDEEVNEIIERHGLMSKTKNTTTDRDLLRENLEVIRERGYALDDEENVLGLRCIAAPIMHEDRVFGAISVSGPSRRMNRERFQDDLPETVTRAANVIQLNSRFS
ncbi:IclR family transcriptional regulator [Halococcus sp. PRR34]|uniref:IclR family transcriptional regulator n=1 Tax=Halococcus sp. PRR34 TaxID=3020830 RepID=UPI002361E196|nr:IclR family transcriptional regulator [Halococcus sp. PRR34]